MNPSSTSNSILGELHHVGITVADIERSVDYYSKVFGGDVGALLAHFVADAALDDDQIAQLRQLLAQKKPPREKRR